MTLASQITALAITVVTGLDSTDMVANDRMTNENL